MEVDLPGYTVVPTPDPDRIVIRYEGGDAASHEIDLRQLGESLQGFAKCIAVAANFAATGTPAQHFDALSVRVVARPTEEHNCFEVWAFIKPVLLSKEMWAGAAAVILTPILAYIFSRRTKDEMKLLHEALMASIGQNHETEVRLISTVEKLAEALNPSVRKALTPIGQACAEIDLLADGRKVQSMDEETKAVYSSRSSRIYDHSRVLVGVISEFDMRTGTCKVQLDGEADRVPAKVVDPVYSTPNNAYVTAMAAATPIRFVAKIEVDDDSRAVSRLHIFDTAEDS